jgi:hypothetical protein
MKFQLVTLFPFIVAASAMAAAVPEAAPEAIAEAVAEAIADAEIMGFPHLQARVKTKILNRKRSQADLYQACIREGRNCNFRRGPQCCNGATCHYVKSRWGPRSICQFLGRP